MLRTNRPAPVPPKGVPITRQAKQTSSSFNSYVSNDRNNNLGICPTVIRPFAGTSNKKKAPPPRPAPPKNYEGKQNGGSTQLSPPPDLLADLHDIFGPPQTQKTPANQAQKLASALGANRSGSSRWKKAPAPPKPTGQKSIPDQFSLIDFDAFAPSPMPNISTANQSKIAQKSIDLLCSDPFGPIPQSNSFQNNIFVTDSLFKVPSTLKQNVNTSAMIKSASSSDYSSLHGAGNMLRSSSVFNHKASFFDSAVSQQKSSSFDQKNPSVSSGLIPKNTKSIFDSSAQTFNSQSWGMEAFSPPRTKDPLEKRNSLFSPPEPKFPPPPPPPDADQTEISECMALYDFSSSDPEELSFCTGDVLMLTEKVNGDWWKGYLKGKSGLFPSSYVEVFQPQMENGGTVEGGSPDKAKGCFVTAVYDFEGEQTEDLRFKAGDSIEVLYRINQNWLYGKCANREGQFPSNFVQKKNVSHSEDTYQAKYDFQGENMDELSFRQNEIICIVEKINDDWWRGFRREDKNKNIGLLPATFLEFLS